jgi:hypothetical protein
MRIVKRVLALGAAVVAMAVFAAPASAGGPSENASCQAIVTSDLATSGGLQGGAVSDLVHGLGHVDWAALNQFLAQSHGPDCHG